MSADLREESAFDFHDAWTLLSQAGVKARAETDLERLRAGIGAEDLRSRPISGILCALAVGDRFAAEFEPGSVEDGAYSRDLLALRVSKEARLDPAAALTALARLSGQHERLTGAVQTLQPGDGFEYLNVTIDGAKKEVVIDATAGFDPSAGLARLARMLERGRKAFYLHRRGALVIVLHLHEDMADALNGAEPGLLEPLTGFEIDLPLLRMSRKTLRRLPLLLFALSGCLWLFALLTGGPIFGLRVETLAWIALVCGGIGSAAAMRR